MLELRVLNGLHRGAALPVIEGRTSIGAGDDCDVVLLDLGIAARECVLLRHGDLIWLHPVGDGCRSARGELRRVSKRVRERRAFLVGERWPIVRDRSAQWPRRVPSPRYATRSTRRGRVFAGGSSAAGRSSALVRPGIEPLVPTVPGPGPGGWTRRLTDIALTRSVWGRAEPRAAGLPAVTMTATGRRCSRKRGPRSSACCVMSQAELLPFKVDSVMSGPSASVTIGADKRLFVGDEFGGWKLAGIDSSKVVFQGHRRV
jgi:type III secretion protein D